MAVIARTRRRVHASIENGAYSTPVGSTSKIGTPSNTLGSYRVHIHDQFTGRLQRVGWSTPATTGQWQFHGLRASTYYVAAFDHTGQYGGVIETDIVLPTPAP
ncbi:MAG: hypothetical protein A2W72_24275 [Burkholderiales bacterium RIFCSPLOWO2_12_67_14]|nr:MAG: hypothetical protein A3I64_07035 [Burkholderiales bacterium RIFCSPLOWO2_02_FULL_67_64]OGB39992.1 MAG: hypothetical protein A3E51_05320 [Burkholderiales bacterium RIFCSPHIGHO2_12_FULL_67_38]OGB43972.1 MAG: hypothetical protein A2W72_24275 [Burkholderiales bacterium RIFCSPLOWO2_12_67_14]OGB87177.1 MAG: hypothetical protein A3G82_19405 [Burkholderiales bacterium RIFCSPLOWO2_12_FULL_67_210]